MRRIPAAASDDSGHEGGAWKVAYADFVTAMMALFIVLWLMNADREVKHSISQYFREPKGVTSRTPMTGPNGAGSGKALSVTSSNVNMLQKRLQESIRSLPEFKKLETSVQFIVSSEGLRIELTETEGGMFFETGSPTPTEQGGELFRLLAEEMGRLPNDIAIEGHTDARSFRKSSLDAYGNWDLSFDRANMARRVMLQTGLRPEQVVEIRGYADRRVLIPNDPMDSRNRRVSVVVKYKE
ncbi:MAG: flagellar motor protein MotB [Acidobacteria bacterium]|nr:flagellar motor protein MotB [Acidobacteriota bacterium]